MLATLLGMLVLFVVGFIEMLIATTTVQMIQKERTLLAGAMTFLSVIVWCYLVRVIGSQGDGHTLVYALGCTIGTMAKIKMTKLEKGIFKKIP